MVRFGCRGCPGGIPFEAPTCDTFMWFRGCLLASFLFIQTWTRIFNLMKPPEGWTFMGALRQCSFPRSRRSGRERYLRSNVCLDIFLFLQLLSGRTLKQTSDLATSHRQPKGEDSDCSLEEHPGPFLAYLGLLPPKSMDAPLILRRQLLKPSRSLDILLYLCTDPDLTLVLSPSWGGGVVFSTTYSPYLDIQPAQEPSTVLTYYILPPCH